MKILIFVSGIDESGGGPSRSVPMLVRGLAEIGNDVTLMTLRSEKMNTHSLDGTTAKLQILDKFTSSEVQQFIKDGRFDIIHLQTIWELEYHKLAHIAIRCGIPYVISPRGMLEPWSLSQKKWKKRLAMALYQRSDLNNASLIVATAEAEAEHIHNLRIKAPCVVIPNGLDTNSYQCRTEIDMVKNQVLFLSRIHPKKGVELLLDAWKELSHDFPDWSLKIVGNGDGDYINKLNSRIHHLGIVDSVEILKPVFGKEKEILYQSSALFVLPSYSENFGMVVAEAMSCGVPVLTTKNCPWEILNETNTGWCIDLNINNLEKHLRLAMGMDPQSLYNMGQRASEVAREKYDYRFVADLAVSSYKRAIDKAMDY